MSDNPFSAGNQQERLPEEDAKRWFVAGLVEGEGSVTVSIKRHPTAALGYLVQPELFVYQHRRRRVAPDTRSFQHIAEFYNYLG